MQELEISSESEHSLFLRHFLLHSPAPQFDVERIEYPPLIAATGNAVPHNLDRTECAA